MSAQGQAAPATRLRVLALSALGGLSAAAWAQPNPAGIDWQPVGSFHMARTETTVGQFQRFAHATGSTTHAERTGGGEVYEAGWVRKPGWTWRTPFGGKQPAGNDEPAVHLGFHEAQAFCRWAGGQLPTDSQWVAAAYTEQRPAPPPPFERGKTYRYPTGDAPAGAQCLGDCGDAAQARAIHHGAPLWRGDGHARAGTTPAGVNGLHEMGANVWEWVDEPPHGSADAPRRTRGGSWWYGAAHMRADLLQSKPAGTAAVYIGFRCARGG